MSVRRKTVKVQITKCTTGSSSWYYNHEGALVVINTTEELGGDNSIWFRVVKVNKILEKKLQASGTWHEWIRKGDFITLNRPKTEQKRVRTVRIL